MWLGCIKFNDALFDMSLNMIKIEPLKKHHVLLIIIYSLIFPLSNLMGGVLSSIALWLTAPFMLLGWLGGMIFVWVAGTERAYLLGVFISIFAQVWVFIRAFC